MNQRRKHRSEASKTQLGTLALRQKRHLGHAHHRFGGATEPAEPWQRGRRFGAIAAAEVISHVGPRPLVELRTLVG